ncbi:Hypothetical protein R9X50_00705900 [Acrodontium crateriforme]|uniref:CNH domain-containing protein n=1 Tax=Acrodontium crateriforme TaxID=150365 RepID=A0AAQ3RBY9_9PEZI|nr:Hypothetical protein R9X50_00705900 [Acrodontium crateriforme]
MLSAFKLQPIHELKPRDKSKIDSLLAYGDKLLVGLNTGSLRIYRINEPGSPTEPDSENGDAEASKSKSDEPVIECLRDEERFSKKPIQQLAIIKEANLLISLSDGYINLHDLQTYEPVERLERTKGAACFAVTSNVVKDPETKVPSLVSRLAVGVKRKTVVWTWQDMEILPDVAEIGLEASVKSLTWVTGTRLMVGMDPGFSVVDIETQEIMPVNKTAAAAVSDANTGELAGVRFGAVSSSGMGYMGMGSWVPKPMATGIAGGQVLLAKDVNTLFTEIDGQPMEKRQIPWSHAPEAIGYSYPYLLALQSPERGTLHIRNPDTLSLLQSIPVPNASILHVPQPYISLAHAGKGFLVASDRVIWRMNAVSYYSQLSELVQHHRYDEAISLLNLLEDTLIDDKAGRIREIMIQKATMLFQEQKYRPALDLFTEAETSPDRVISLYPKSIAGENLGTPDGSDSEGEAPHENGTPKIVEKAKAAPSTPSKGMLSRLIPGVAGGSSETAHPKSPAPIDADNISVRSKSGKKADKPTDRPLEGDDLKAAVNELCSFLAQARVKIKNYLNADGTLVENPPKIDAETGKPSFANLLPQSTFENETTAIDWQAELLKTAELVHTTLFRAYMLVKPSLAGSLFRIDNFCDPQVVQASLYETERYIDLIDFLHGKKMHRQALEMLQKFGKDNADGEVPAGMQGPDRTVAYLKQLPPDLIDIVLEFVRWPIETKPAVGMEVFLADSDNAERLPRKRVASFLGAVDETLEAQYLDHIVNELGDQEPEFHQKLVDIYIQRLKSDRLPSVEKELTQQKLEDFLRRSKVYSKAKTFGQLPTENEIFFESRAIVLSAMGNHKQALAIYVFQIKDQAKAEDYCNKTYLAEQLNQQACLLNTTTTHEKHFRPVESDDSNNSNIFATLLGLYLRPPEGEEKRWPQALDLLSKHGARLPASSTLELMPDDLAVNELQNYFRGRIRNATSILREEQIVRSLTNVRRDNAERLLLVGPDSLDELGKKAGRNRRVRITEDDHCKVCHKRFGASAVRVYPDNEVVHYGCVGKRAREVGTTSPRNRRASSGWK